jgi:S-sulfo-L-cysteine synthase (O-acetyl-L-serine-dependent)
MIYNHITDLIGNTPLLKIDPNVHKLKNIDLYAKLEFYNPFGSVKDRIAYAMIKDDLPNIIKAKQTILESSSGNTAKALQAIASIYGVSFKTITNRIKVKEVEAILQIMGAEIEQLPGQSECPDPTDPYDPLTHIDNVVKVQKDKYYYTTQYTNEKNIEAHYESTGKEIVNDLGVVDYFFGGLGTTGSTRGTATFIKKSNPDLVSVGIVSSIDDYIPGIRTINEMLDVGLFEKDFYQAIEEINSKQAINAMLTLIRQCGVLAGPTSGASYEGAIKFLNKIDADLNARKTAVFIACDRFEYYVSYIRERRQELFGENQKQDTISDLSKSDYQKYQTISLSEVEKWIEARKPLLIDLRSNFAFKTLRIPNSINIPQEQLKRVVDGTMPFSEGQTLLFLCPTGEQSKKYAAYLQKKGYNAFSLDSGIVGWRDAGLPIERTVAKEEDYE